MNICLVLTRNNKIYRFLRFSSYLSYFQNLHKIFSFPDVKLARILTLSSFEFGSVFNMFIADNEKNFNFDNSPYSKKWNKKRVPMRTQNIIPGLLNLVNMDK